MKLEVYVQRCNFLICGVLRHFSEMYYFFTWSCKDSVAYTIVLPIALRYIYILHPTSGTSYCWVHAWCFTRSAQVYGRVTAKTERIDSLLGLTDGSCVSSAWSSILVSSRNFFDRVTHVFPSTAVCCSLLCAGTEGYIWDKKHSVAW